MSIGPYVNKTFSCSRCSENNCIISVNHATRPPYYCPLDKGLAASFIEVKDEDMSKGKLEQLQQLTKATWDGDLICKRYRDELIECGYTFECRGFNMITYKGIEVLVNLGILKQGESA